MSAHPARTTFPWPPLFYLTAAAAAFVLQVVYPLGWVPEPLAGMLLALGALMIAAAIAVDIAAIRLLRAGRTPVMPGRQPVALVTTGPFAVSRNPIYVSHTGMVIGLGLVLANAWCLPLAILAALATGRLGIRREEARLEAAFGRRFRDYRARVRRWL